MAAQIEVTDRQAVRLIYGASTGSDAFEDCDGKTIFAEEYIWWLEDKVYRAANIMEGVRERAPNRQSKPCHRCADYELILDVNYCPFCGFEFIRG